VQQCQSIDRPGSCPLDEIGEVNQSKAAEINLHRFAFTLLPTSFSLEQGRKAINSPPTCRLRNKYYRTQITRNLQFYGSPGHWEDTKVTFRDRIPEWVMGYNQRSSPISFSEFIQ